MSTDTEIQLRAREMALELTPAALAKGVLMYMPAGAHTITPSAGQGSCEVTVAIDELTAPVLNASLAATNARLFPQKCYIDFEHEGKEATAWPKEFFWSDTGPDGQPAPGIYARAEFSEYGRRMVAGKTVRAFSPSFSTDADLPKAIRAGQHVVVAKGKRGSRENPARVTRVVAPDIGTLTNNPAFKNILPLWATCRRGGGDAAARARPEHAGAENAGEEPSNQNSMKLTEQELVSLRARKKDLEQGITVLRAKDQTEAANAEALRQAETDLESVTTKLQAHDVADKNETLENALRAQRTKDADDAIKAAVKRGAIPAKDEALQTKWRNRLIEDPSDLVLLQSMNGSPALNQPRITISNGGAQEMRASNRDVLRRYLQHIQGNEVNDSAAIYASEIRKRILEGDDLPLRAADVTDADLGTLAGTLVAQRTLDFFQLQFDGLFDAISTDFSSENAAFNTSIMSRVVVAPAVEDYHVDNGWVQSTAAKTTDVEVKIDKHRGVPIKFNTNMLAQTMRRLFDEQAAPAAYVLAKDMVDNLYARILAANFADPAPFAEAEIDFGRKTFGKVGRIFNPLGVPETGRFALLNSDYHDALEQDPTLTNLATYQSGRENIITAGRLPKIKNFQPIEAPNLPATGNLAAFFGHKSSLLIASRVPSDYTAVLPGGASHGLVKVVKNPNNGMTCLVVWFADHQKGTGNFRIAAMYGTAKGYAKGGQIVTSA